MHTTDELDALERIVPQDLSEWPTYAQVLYLQVQRIGRKMDNLQHAVEGDNGIKDTLKDHERRIKLLESALKWAAGIGTAIITYVAIAIAQGRKLI